MMRKVGLWTQGLQMYFTPHQLQQLNVYFSDMEMCQDLKYNQTTIWVESEIEKLIQYLCYEVGNLDSRFSSEFLIRLEPTRAFVKNRNCFSYLIRLDTLSVPSNESSQNPSTNFHIEFDNDKAPEGFSKVKLDDEASLRNWRDCATSTGYLRRDKLQKKFIELLEEAASPKLESVQGTLTKIMSYNSPGKIIDAETLYHILNVPPQERIFYGSSEDVKKFDSSDVRKFRVEVIESNHLIRLRIGFLAPNVVLDEDIDVILILGIGLQGWPSTSDFPHRILFTNADILLHQQMATTGFYLMSAFSSQQNNKNKSTLWQFFFPTVDCMLTNHFSDVSCVNRIINIVYIVMLNLRRTTPGGHSVGKYLIKTLLWFQLEKMNEPKYWTSDYLSFHVISILDEIISCLRRQTCRSYFFDGYNVISNSFRSILSQNTSEDYKVDADIIETFLQRIYALSSSELIGHQSIMGERRQNNSSAYETLLMQKWSNLLISMINNRKRDEKIIGFVAKQIEYITFLFRAVLITKSAIIPINNRKINASYSAISYSSYILKGAPHYRGILTIEDALYIISLIFEQAKRSYLLNLRVSKGSHRSLDPKMECQYSEGVKQTLKHVKESPGHIFSSDFQAVKFILEALYESTIVSKTIRKILNPYLKAFSISTHENCWYLEEWRNRIYNDELMALRIFSKLVSEKKIKFKIGLLDALQKGWDWAFEMFRLCIKLKNGQDLLFVLPNGQITRRYLILSDEEIESLTRHQLNATKYGLRGAVSDLYESLKVDGHLAESFVEDDLSEHFQLRDGSPMSLVINNNRRHGMHLGLGNIIFSLITLGKFTVLQEITEALPEERQHQALEAIQRAIKEKQRSDRERGKFGDRREIFRPLPDMYQTLNESKNETLISNGSSHQSNGNLSIVFDDNGSSTAASSGTCSSSKSDRRPKSSDYMFCNPIAYYDAPVTYFHDENDINWRNPVGQPYLTLSSDNQLSLASVHTNQSAVSIAESKTFSVKM